MGLTQTFMLAANYNITLDRAADYSFVLVVNDANGDPVDVDGDSFAADIRLTGSKQQALEFTTSTPATGQILLALTAAQTKTLLSGSNYEYDVFLIRAPENGGRTIRLIEGSVTVRAQRTNDV